MLSVTRYKVRNALKPQTVKMNIMPQIKSWKL